MSSLEAFCEAQGIVPATPEAVARAIEKEEFRNLWSAFKEEAPLKGDGWNCADRSVGIDSGWYEEMVVERGGPKWATEVLESLAADTYQELLGEEMDTFIGARS